MFQTLDYPITGELKILLLMLEWISAFLFFEFGIIFLLRKNRNKEDLKILQEKAVIYLGFGFSLMMVLKIIGDYYIYDSGLRTVFSSLSLFSFIGGGLIFVYVMDKYKLLYFKRYQLTISYSILFIVFIILNFISASYRSIFSIAFIPFLVIYFIYFLRKLKSIYFKRKEFRKYRITSSLFLIGVIFVFSGYSISTDFLRIALNMDLTIRLVSALFLIIGSILLGAFYLSIPSFAEYDWRDSLEGVLIMHNNGLPIYKKIFVERLGGLEGVITGVMTSVKIILESLTERKGVSIIKQEDRILIIQPRENFSGVLLCQELLLSPQILLKIFMERIERSYSEVLKTWKGNLTIFRPLERMYKEIFG